MPGLLGTGTPRIDLRALDGEPAPAGERGGDPAAGFAQEDVYKGVSALFFFKWRKGLKKFLVVCNSL